MADDNNSIISASTENYLSEVFEDLEVYMREWISFRRDWVRRNFGGTIIYVTENIPLTNDKSYSNNYCDFIALFLSNETSIHENLSLFTDDTMVGHGDS